MKTSSSCPLFVALACFLGATAAIAMHPNHPIGFDPERAYQQGDVDQVDLFSGSLSLRLPIGALMLTYSSNVWFYEQVFDPASGELHIQARPDWTRNAGLGWTLSWGEVYSPTHAYNQSGRWLYVGPDGGRHLFYDELHRGESTASNAFYTRDGSYLRLIKVSNTKVVVQTPDGKSRSFVAPTGGGGTTYRLKKVWSSFTSESDPDFTAAYDADYLEWSITDRWGRTQVVTLTDQYAWLPRVVTRVDVVSVGGTRAIYDFVYDDIHVDRSCKDDDPDTPDRIRVPHLVRIDLPDGTSYRMKQGGERFYYNVCSDGMDDNPGVLTGLLLPTGGKLEWVFQQFEFPPGDNSSVFNTTAGVRFRRLRRADGVLEGQWRYRSRSYWPSGGEDPEMRTEVVYPTGDCRKHFFNARYWLTPSQGRGWERGLPFSYEHALDGMFLSTEQWSGNDGNGACAGSKLRSTYLQFRRDQLPPANAPQADWLNTNRTAKASRVVYHDDGDRFTQVMHSDFDGLGHFRRAVRTGNFWSSSANQERRTVITDFHPGRGTYPGSYVPVELEEPWILGSFASIETIEPEAIGETSSRVEYDFDSNTGGLRCTRVVRSGTVAGPHDLLTTYGRDPLGKILDERVYGGDLQSLPTGPSPDPCGTGTLPPVSWQRHSYAYGTRRTTRHLDAVGNPAPFLSYDVDLDPATGRVLTSRDANGLATVYRWDLVGRLTSVEPPAAARTAYRYHNASPGAGPAITVERRRDDGKLGEVIAQAELRFDDFGRLILERQRVPDGSWSERQTAYNARGWTTSISEWGSPSTVTRFLDFDPFGRPGRTRPPEGPTHDLLHAYVGDRLLRSTTMIAGLSGEERSTTTRELDRHGRLRRVIEPLGDGGLSGEPGTSLTTTYDYDVGNRRTRSRSGDQVTQERRFVYDNRGFLLAETHPEKGASGNGTVAYSELQHQVEAR